MKKGTRREKIIMSSNEKKKKLLDAFKMSRYEIKKKAKLGLIEIVEKQ